MVQSSTLLTKVVHHYLQLRYLHRNSSSTQQGLQIARATRITHLTTRLSRFPLFTILASFVFILYQVVTNSFFCPFLITKSDGTHCTIASWKEASDGWPIWKIMEMEKKPPPMVVTIQMEMAKTLEAL